MLDIGSRNTLQIRQVAIPLGIGLRLLYISDLHLTRWAAHIVEQLDQVCRMVAPDVILLGGDLVDLSNGLPLLAQFIQAQPCPIYAVAGNHDELVGIDQIRESVLVAGGSWLDQRVRLHPQLVLDGVCQVAPDEPAILCTHDPAIFPQAVAAGYRLVLAGHLHGGQCILAQYQQKWYPNAFFFRWSGDQFQCQNTTMLVSKGVHDTLPIRWNCPREVLLCLC